MHHSELPLEENAGRPYHGLSSAQLWRLSLFLWGFLFLILAFSSGCDEKRTSRSPGTSAGSNGARSAEVHQGAAASPQGPSPAMVRDGPGSPDESGVREPGPREPGAREPGKGDVRSALTPLPAEVDLGKDVRGLFDLLFCDQRDVDRHCQHLVEAMDRYRKQYREPMRAWLDKERPKGLPSTLLYPFAGGDLVSALSAFPDQSRFVHLALEHGGPPDSLRDGTPAQIAKARSHLFRMSNLLLRHGESFSVDLQKQEQALLPGVLPMLLVGIRLHGGVPTGLSYLRLTPEGRLERWTRRELEEGGPRARRLYTTWKDPRFSARFAHLELRFRLPGDTEDRRVIHLSANLANVGLSRAPGVEKLIGSLGPVALMIKASSYLMWTEGFSRIRELIFQGAAFAISDLTAPFPAWLRKRGFRVFPHGRYDCMRNPNLRQSAKPWIKAYRKSASSKVPFRWGYQDCHRHNHVVLVRRQTAQ